MKKIKVFIWVLITLALIVALAVVIVDSEKRENDVQAAVVRRVSGHYGEVESCEVAAKFTYPYTDEPYYVVLVNQIDVWLVGVHTCDDGSYVFYDNKID